jgi:hypothetical protein
MYADHHWFDTTGMSMAWKISCGVSACAMAKGSPRSTTRCLSSAPKAFW